LQAARVLAGELSASAAPLRLFYVDRVFRNVPEGKGALREIWQAGAELAGVSGAEADAEIIAIALEALAALGVRDMQVDLGHTSFVRDFLSDLKLAPDATARLADALGRKDTRALQDLLAEGVLDEQGWQTAQKLIGAFGLVSAEELRSGGATSQAAVESLLGIAGVLKAYGVEAKVTFDAGEVRGLDYYTGFFFHIYAPGVGRPLAAGGRYDGLIGRFGRDLPAVGCAIDLEAAVANVPLRRANRVHIVALQDTRTGALALARRLRDAGNAVSRDIIRRPWEESLEFARQAGMDFVVLLESEGKQRLVEVASGKQREFSSADEVVAALAK
jgi:ATP phosphoribosyltransferase regulatory subunit